MDSLFKKQEKKRFSELLVEAGIVKPEELPKGLEYARKASDSDFEAVTEIKRFIDEQGLTVPTALRALTLAKQRRCGVEQALLELGWRPAAQTQRAAVVTTPRAVKSAFDASLLDAIGTAAGPTYETAPDYCPAVMLSAEETPAFFDEPPVDNCATENEHNLEPAPQSFVADMDAMSSMSQVFEPAVQEPDVRYEEHVSNGNEMLLIIQTGDQHFSEQRYAQAEQVYSEALAVLEGKGGAEAAIADLLVKMGRATLQAGEFHRAEAYFCRALKIREVVAGSEDIVVAECLDYLAEVYDLQSQYLEAENYYLSALGIKERVLNPDNSEVSRSLKKLVAVSKRRGAMPEEKLSGELLTEAGLVDPARLDEGLKAAQSGNMPIGRALISLNYLTDEDLQSVLQAQLLLREGVVPAYIAVRALRLASQQQTSLKVALQEIGLEPEDDGAKPVFDLLNAAQELLDAEKSLPVNDPALAALCVKVGDVYTDHGRYAQSETLYRRALAIAEQQGSAPSRELCEIHGRIGDLKFRQGQFVEAQDIYGRLLDMWEAAVGSDDVNFVNCLESHAAVQYVNGNYVEAGRLYQLAVTGKEKLYGSEHPGVASAIQGRANSYFALGRYPEAEQLYLRARDMYEKVYGFHSEYVASLYNVIGDLFYSQGQFPQAQFQYSKGLEAYSKCTNPDVSAFAAMLEKVAHCFVQSGDYTRAEAYYRHFVKTREGFGSFYASDMPDALERFAAVLDNLQRGDEAAAVRQQAQAVRVACAGQ